MKKILTVNNLKLFAVSFLFTLVTLHLFQLILHNDLCRTGLGIYTLDCKKDSHAWQDAFPFWRKSFRLDHLRKQC